VQDRVCEFLPFRAGVGARTCLRETLHFVDADIREPSARLRDRSARSTVSRIQTAHEEGLMRLSWTWGKTD